jgi:hypothetical protein
LITDAEEIGSIGADYLMDVHIDIAQTINESAFMIQFDRRNGTDYKFYNLSVSDDFRDYIQDELPDYHGAGTGSSTDIVRLCRKVCGVNVSVGYYDEHCCDETLVISEWLHTYKAVSTMLAKPLQQFPLM